MKVTSKYLNLIEIRSQASSITIPVDQRPKTECEVIKLKDKIEKEVQSQQNNREKIAILDFTGFEMKDRFDILKSRKINKEFNRLVKAKNPNNIGTGKIAYTYLYEYRLRIGSPT